jgi:predicted PurR-regulated permease PerM
MINDESLNEGVFTRERVLTLVLGIFTLLAIYICYLIIEPFIPPVAFALALAVATQTPFCWLRARMRSNIAAAAISVTLVAALIIVPAVLLMMYIVQTGAQHVDELQRGEGLGGLRGMLERQPFIGPLVQEITSRFRLDEQIGNLGQAIASRATGVVSGSIGVLTQLAVTLFVLFFLYRDSGQAAAALRKLLPLSNKETDRMFDRVGSTIAATVNGSLTVALVQATLAGIVYVILGVPGAVLWGAVTFLAALVPVFGTFLVWSPIALYLLLTGSIIKAIVLIAWGALIVGSVDNVLYPYLVGDKLRLHTVPIFFSVLGGLALFGPAGIILGPMALAITIALIDVWWHRTEHGYAAEVAMSRRPEDAERPGSALQGRVT